MARELGVESGPNFQTLEIGFFTHARARTARTTQFHAACIPYTYARIHGEPGVHAASNGGEPGVGQGRAKIKAAPDLP